MQSASSPAIDDEQLAWQLDEDGTLSLVANETARSIQPDHSPRATQPPPASLAPWTRRIIAGEASLTDVPTCNLPRIAREVKAYADHFPDVGASATVTRLVTDLRQAEVTVDGY